MKPDLGVLRQSLGLLERAPRETALLLWDSPVSCDEVPFGLLGLTDAAKEYWTNLLSPKASSPSELQRELSALAGHAEKLKKGLAKLPARPSSEQLEDWQSHLSYDEEGRPWGGFDGNAASLQALSKYLNQWSSEVEISPVGPVKRPIKPPAGWTKETDLAFWIASFCRENRRPVRHALPITKAVLAWAARGRGTRTRPLGVKAWRMVEAELKK